MLGFGPVAYGPIGRLDLTGGANAYNSTVTLTQSQQAALLKSDVKLIGAVQAQFNLLHNSISKSIFILQTSLLEMVAGITLLLTSSQNQTLGLVKTSTKLVVLIQIQTTSLIFGAAYSLGISVSQSQIVSTIQSYAHSCVVFITQIQRFVFSAFRKPTPSKYVAVISMANYNAIMPPRRSS